MDRKTAVKTVSGTPGSYIFVMSTDRLLLNSKYATDVDCCELDQLTLEGGAEMKSFKSVGLAIVDDNFKVLKNNHAVQSHGTCTQNGHHRDIVIAVM